MDLAVVQPVLEDLSMERPILRSGDGLVPPPNQITVALVEDRTTRLIWSKWTLLISDGEEALWGTAAERRSSGIYLGGRTGRALAWPLSFRIHVGPSRI